MQNALVESFNGRFRDECLNDTNSCGGWLTRGVPRRVGDVIEAGGPWEVHRGARDCPSC